MAATDTAGAAGGVSRGYARYALALLLVVYVINYVDRQVLSILVEPIRKELGLTDTQIGLLSGLGFALFYAAAGLPIARLADRTSRKGIIAGCLALWSGATAVCGLAMNFPQLLVARIFVAVGEAGAGPAGHSMLADLFPHGKRATALAVFSCGVPIGILVGLLAGGWLNQAFDWRTAFIVVGLPGVVVAAVVALTLKEPPRTGEVSTEPAPTTREALAVLMKIPAYNYLVLGSALHAFTSYGALQWNPAFMIRFHGLSTGEAGLALGLISGVTGVVGTLAGGWFADLLGRRDNRWYAWLPALMIGVRAPLFISAYLAPTAELAIACLILPGFLGNSFTGPVFGTIQTLSPPRTRAFASAWTLFIIALVGFGLGPLVIGMTSDALAPAFGTRSLGYAISLAAIGELVSVVFFLLAARRLPRNAAPAAP
ncbi:MAG: MFS transporter [Phenylobacterium sp.]|uniref:spinster family MFS transporter n=1 Tax=Phenylobacterium sp. TaxID=1871053 RepID=UPI001A6446FF|nr:MFS transporter [Phenylobacterium sp.]MBL8772999.1 MFS transporter [Phenylobacterium sp.]